MAISPFQRLVSNASDVFLGSDRDQAAMNAANNTGDHPDVVARRVSPLPGNLYKNLKMIQLHNLFPPLARFPILSIFGISLHQMVRPYLLLLLLSRL